MPASAEFTARAHAVLSEVVERFGTPVHLYDARGIDETCEAVNAAFTGLDFREYYAVKALPNPVVMARLAAHGFGFDCSSLPELSLVARAGGTGADVCFTSNNTSRAELAAAAAMGALINVDDVSVLAKLAELPQIPETICIRVNPGSLSNTPEGPFLGTPETAKFGVRIDRLAEACREAGRMGVRRFGLHTMLASNSLHAEPLLVALDILLDQATALRESAGAEVVSVNLGGGVGIPYRPQEQAFDLRSFGAAVRARIERWRGENDGRPMALHLESGRFVTGPHGILITRVVNRMSKWREYVGVDASMSSLMRPGLYPTAYHHVTAAAFADPAAAEAAARGHTEVVDVVGSLCENSDKFAIQRELPPLAEGDVILIHDTGAHGHSMGFTYNGRLRPAEVLLHADDSVQLIRRAETEHDYFATLEDEHARQPARVGA
jgi:diaminopimelate decarboxylase